MKQNIDELINKYIDGELSSKEIDEFNSLVESDELILRKLKAQKLVHAYLKEIEPDPAPVASTQNIMSRISRGLNKKLDRNYFFFSVMGFLMLSLLGTIVFFFAYFSYTTTEYKGTESIITSTSEFINNFVISISARFVDANIMLIVSTITLIVMLGIYFLFESHKSFRKKLHTLS